LKKIPKQQAKYIVIQTNFVVFYEQVPTTLNLPQNSLFKKLFYFPKLLPFEQPQVTSP
jgi:hypothetical protein